MMAVSPTVSSPSLVSFMDESLLALEDEQALKTVLEQLDSIPDVELPSVATADPIQLSYLYLPRKTNPIQWTVKRAFDVVFTASGLLAISLPLLVIALLVKTTSPGPLLFSQERIGLHGQKFKMYKFRSMYVDAEERLKELMAKNESQNNAMFKMKDDPRITPVGKWLRKFSLDEFPQLINVLKGEMSLVGPRPPIERELTAYEPWHYVRFSTVPGLTGAWQVSGRSNIKNFNDVVRLDFNYIRTWSVFQDLMILLKTVPVVLFAKGAV